MYIKKDENNDFEQMMKNSFKLPLVKEDLFRAIKERNEYKMILKKDFDMSEFKKIVKSTKAKGQNLVLFFNEDDVKFIESNLINN